ncbi:hypothetical protein [Methanocella arvoryzae]|nr:hypothetical protein [Methanocella arvoryzae]
MFKKLVVAGATAFLTLALPATAWFGRGFGFGFPFFRGFGFGFPFFGGFGFPFFGSSFSSSLAFSSMFSGFGGFGGLWW